jgi:hypothetical protein
MVYCLLCLITKEVGCLSPLSHVFSSGLLSNASTECQLHEDLHPQEGPSLPNELVTLECGGPCMQYGVGRLCRVAAIRCPPQNRSVRLVSEEWRNE